MKKVLGILIRKDGENVYKLSKDYRFSYKSIEFTKFHRKFIFRLEVIYWFKYNSDHLYKTILLEPHVRKNKQPNLIRPEKKERNLNLGFLKMKITFLK